MARRRINEMNKNRQTTKEFDKEDLEEVEGQSLIAVRNVGQNHRQPADRRDPMYPGLCLQLYISSANSWMVSPTLLQQQSQFSMLLVFDSWETKTLHDICRTPGPAFDKLAMAGSHLDSWYIFN